LAGTFRLMQALEQEPTETQRLILSWDSALAGGQSCLPENEAMNLP